MPHSGVSPVRRVTVDPAGADYASAFAATVGCPTSLTPEGWARATFEDAPAPLRWFLRAAWLGGLGLRLGPRSSPDHVLGWLVVESTPGAITLEARSPLLSARNVVSVNGPELVWATFVDFDRRAGRPLWTSAAPLHHRIIPFLLGQAIRRAS